MKEIVTAYKDKGDANGVKKVQSAGLHVGGERFVVLKADERSLYGKKVRPPTRLTSAALQKATTQRIHTDGQFNTGQRRHCHCQDDTGDPRHALPRDCATRLCCQHRRAARRLPGQRGILDDRL